MADFKLSASEIGMHLMVFWLKFSGELRISKNSASATHFCRSLAAALASEGAVIEKVTDYVINFRGVAHRTITPLQNIKNGEIEVEATIVSVKISYRIMISYYPLLVSVGVILFGFLLFLSGVRHGQLLAAFGACALFLVVTHSWFIRAWFTRWLRTTSMNVVK
jgi:hypothetical protein